MHRPECEFSTDFQGCWSCCCCCFLGGGGGRVAHKAPRSPPFKREGYLFLVLFCHPVAAGENKTEESPKTGFVFFFFA